MNQYRVTKYNPEFRNAEGVYTKDEWTSFSEVGKTVSKGEYAEVEAAYIDTAIQFFEEQGIAGLAIVYLENSAGYKDPKMKLAEGEIVHKDNLASVIRGILRENYWAKLESKNAYLHFGWDFYMYIGVPLAASQAITVAERNGLFVEEFESPYLSELYQRLARDRGKKRHCP